MITVFQKIQDIEGCCKQVRLAFLIEGAIEKMILKQMSRLSGLLLGTF